MLGSNLVVPVVLWGPNSLTHCISSIFYSENTNDLVTGCYDGQLCIWKMGESGPASMTPIYLLIGHTAPILSICKASILPDYNYIVSASENGELCLWDLTDGKCIESTKLPQVHTSLQAYHMAGSDDIRLFCNGYYTEILIIDPFSLEILFSLSSKVNPDWISAMHVLRPKKRKDDVVLAITTTGIVKVWTLLGNENKLSEPIYENESKQIRCLNALSMKCCSENQRTVLIVCAKYWQVYDAGDFTILCSVIAPAGERWMGGDFLTSERIILWSDCGKGYLYRLPTNSIPEHPNFHKPSGEDAPFLYAILSQNSIMPLSCPPAMQYTGSDKSKTLVKGDSEGNIIFWNIPDISDDDVTKFEKTRNTRAINVCFSTSLHQAWSLLKPPSVGILDQFIGFTDNFVKITASTYLPQQSRLVLGRSDGTIVIVPATQMIALSLLTGKTQLQDYPTQQRLMGHNGRINCLLCPYLTDTRYDKSHLVSGGVDFSVCLWDLYSGTLLHRFCIHAGEITQLLAPPSACSPRIQKCICSVASDHSVALLSLQERKCITLASRHLFPVVTIKWRPFDDFMIVGCSDGTAYVWQMETGHLDRVLHGMLANEVLSACDEQTEENVTNVATLNDSQLVNPAVHLFRGIRHRNLSAIKQATTRGIIQLQQLHSGQHGDANVLMKNHSSPLMIQGLKTNPQDAESHILFFDIEGLIFELHSEEYKKMSQTAEANRKPDPIGVDASKKITDFFGKVKAKTENLEKSLKDKDKHGILARVKEGTDLIQTKMQAKVDSVVKNIADATKGEKEDYSTFSYMETTHVMELAQLILSLIHSWGLDPKLDKICENELGLLRPLMPVTFGMLSKAGHLSLLLPTWINAFKNTTKQINVKQIEENGQLIDVFTSKLHWEMSAAMSSNHLLAMVAVSNTLMSMNMATFSSQYQQLINKQSFEEGYPESALNQTQSLIKQGWSQLSTHHCFFLPEKISHSELKSFQKLQVEVMARRWQHHCFEIREAAQQLLLGELERMSKKGRRQLVDNWAQYLPLYTHTDPIMQPSQSTPGSPVYDPNETEYDEEEEEEIIRKPSSISELKRKQTTSVVLLGIILAQFGQDFAAESKDNRSKPDQRRTSSTSEGLIGSNNLPRLVALALGHLVLTPATPKLPAYTPLRRAAIDLIGRGFVVWEPYVDVSKILLGLLELCCDSSSLLPNINYKLPLTPQADACRTARNSLRLIATARPDAFITTMAREVARYNAAQQNTQALSVPTTQSVLNRAKSEILLCIEMLIEKLQGNVSNYLIAVMDIIIHCVDIHDLKNKGLQDVCPLICKYNQVSHCVVSKRIAAGAIDGRLAIYELKQNKCQMMPAHSKAITALAFSPDGKYLVSYCCAENRLSFWQTSSGMFGLGSSQTKCIKNYSTAPIPDLSRFNPMRLAKLIWISNKIVTLMLADGSETRFNL